MRLYFWSKISNMTLVNCWHSCRKGAKIIPSLQLLDRYMCHVLRTALSNWALHYTVRNLIIKLKTIEANISQLFCKRAASFHQCLSNSLYQLHFVIRLQELEVWQNGQDRRTDRRESWNSYVNPLYLKHWKIFHCALFSSWHHGSK